MTVLKALGGRAMRVPTTDRHDDSGFAARCALVAANNFIPMNLGFFNSAQEKTEKPTTRKRKKARDEGQVAISQEFGTAILFIAAFTALRIFAPAMLERLMSLLHINFVYMETAGLYIEVDALSTWIWTMFGQIILIFLPVALAVLACAILINIYQAGWNPTFKPLQPKFSKLSPMKGLKKLFSMKVLFDLVKSLGKFAVILLVVYFIVVREMEMLITLFYMDLFGAVTYLAGVIVTLGLNVGIFYLFIAALDLAYVRFKHEKDLRMSKQDIKDEHKQLEGDPRVKSQIRRKMLQASMRRMMQEIPEADVVITNPTHFACVLKYDRLSRRAPVLVAKGIDHLAFKIIDAAKEHGVVIVEDKPLARTLYSVVDVGEEIPAELWQAVAEVLAYVYNLKAA